MSYRTAELSEGRQRINLFVDGKFDRWTTWHNTKMDAIKHLRAQGVRGEITATTGELN